MTFRFRLPVLLIGAALAMSAAPSRAESTLTLLTGSADSVYFPLGIAIGKLTSDAFPDRTTQIRMTKGAVANLHLLAAHQGDFAFAAANVVAAARDGNANTGFAERLPDLRGIGALYPSVIHVVATVKSGIRTLADLKGKRLAIGAAGSGSDSTAINMLKAAGLDPRDIAIESIAAVDALQPITDGKLDALVIATGLESSFVNALSNTAEVTMVPVPAAVAETLGPPFAPAVIPANTYKGQDQDVPSVAVMNVLVTRADDDDDLVYRVTRLIFTSLPDLTKAHPAARVMSLHSASGDTTLPLHPGALRFYREQGLLRPEDCRDGAPRDNLVAACSVVILDGGTAPAGRVSALLLRGAALQARGDNRRALFDFAAALRLDPQNDAAKAVHKALALQLERDGARMAIERARRSR